MKTYSIDFQASKEVYNRRPDLIKMKMCYNNIASLVLHEYKLSSDYFGIQVVYGAVRAGDTNDKLYVKHCFLIYQGKVIDPTAVLWGDRAKDNIYIIGKTFSFNEYIDQLYLADGDTSLDKPLRKTYFEMMKQLASTGCVLAG